MKRQEHTLCRLLPRLCRHTVLRLAERFDNLRPLAIVVTDAEFFSAADMAASARCRRRTTSSPSATSCNADAQAELLGPRWTGGPLKSMLWTCALGHEQSLVERGPRQQEAEAVAVIATDQVHFPHGPVQDPRRQTQHVVAGLCDCVFATCSSCSDLNQQHAKCGPSPLPFRNPLADVPEERRPIALEPHRVRRFLAGLGHGFPLCRRRGNRGRAASSPLPAGRRCPGPRRLAGSRRTPREPDELPGRHANRSCCGRPLSRRTWRDRPAEAFAVTCSLGASWATPMLTVKEKSLPS